jgi:hypothetical protein
MSPLRPGSVKRPLRLLLAPFFSRLSVLGASGLPAVGPLLILGETRDEVLDPLLVLWASPRRVRCPVRASLFGAAGRSALLERVGFVPILPASSPEGAGESIARCVHLLIGGEAVAVLNGEAKQPAGDPSGPALAAQVLLEASARGVRPTVVTVRWSASPPFPRRGRCLILFSPPLHWDADARGSEARPALEERLAGALSGTGETFAWYQELALLERADPLAQEAAKDAGPISLPPDAPEGGFEERCRWAWLEFPPKFLKLREAAASYFGLLGALRLSPSEAGHPIAQIPDETYFRLLAVVGGFPAALYGATFHALPHAGAAWLAKEWAEERKKAYGTVFPWTALAVFPLFYGSAAWALCQAFGAGRSLAFIATAPPAGLWALIYSQASEGFLRTLAALVRYRFPGRLEREIAKRREMLRAALEPLLWLYR